MASVIQIGKRWRAQVRRKGKSITQTFATKAAADAWARAQETDIERGKAGADAGTITVGELIRSYRTAREQSGRAIKQKSTEFYLLARLEEEFNTSKASILSVKQIIEYAQKRRKDGLAPYSVNMEVSKLGTVLRHSASFLEIDIPDAPTKARPTLRHHKLIGPGTSRDRRPTPEEIRLIFEWCAEHPEYELPLPDVIAVAMQSAFRRGEVFRITRSDTDAERHLQLVRDRKDPQNKAGNDEWVPLVGDCLEILQRQKQRGADDRYFPWDAGTASKYFKWACDAKGVKDLRLHDMRHEAASALFEAGWAVPEVAMVTGHKNWKSLKRYTNLKPADVAKKGRLVLVKKAG